MGNGTSASPTDLVEAALWSFVHSMNMTPPYHPDDVDRFYRFIVLTHERESLWDEQDVKNRLLDYGLPKLGPWNLLSDMTLAGTFC